MKIKTTMKENIYFTISLVASIIIYFFIIKSIAEALRNPQDFVANIVLIIYVVMIILFWIFSHIMMIGRLHGNAVKVTEKQFPEIYDIAVKNCRALEIKKIPTIYLLQSGGLLNAYATRYIGRNYVVLFSDIMEKAFDNGIDVVDFIVAHELTHIKKNHILKRLFIIPANIIFLLTLAYSRACEYTCDLNASVAAPNGCEKGLVLLAAGKHLYEKVNIEEFINDSINEKSFAKWFAEVFSTHPHLTNRIKNIRKNRETVI
ncbi:MAG: M48 family metallopeptidase [Spirochaetales bacterium]|nr:M48 family metallopeptidase [Spirochaetales bacterium]